MLHTLHTRTGKLLLALLVAVAALMGPALPTQAVAADTQVMWRLYNPNTGEHFYTKDTNERDHLATVGWRKEGQAWIAPVHSNTPVYRLYNPVVKGGDHHYTTNSHERDMLVGVGWKYEGVGWYSDDAKSVPLQRLYNPNAATGTHHYTVDTNEANHLVSVGWKHEGVAWYAVGVGENTGSNQGGTGGSTGGSTSQPSTPATSGTYVLNTNSMTFHRPTCPSVRRMSAANRRDYTGSRADVLAMGYDPCKNCNP